MTNTTSNLRITYLVAARNMRIRPLQTDQKANFFKKDTFSICLKRNNDILGIHLFKKNHYHLLEFFILSISWHKCV